MGDSHQTVITAVLLTYANGTAARNITGATNKRTFIERIVAASKSAEISR